MHILTYIVDSENFAAGFFGIPAFLTSYRQLIAIEDPTGAVARNNTLAAICNNTNGAPGALGGAASAAWRDTYLVDATARMNAMLGGGGEEGLQLTTADVVAMQDACAYEVCAGVSYLIGVVEVEVEIEIGG